MSGPFRDGSDIGTYLKDIGATALLTADEEKSLARQIKKGDAKARDRMIRANLRLVVSIAKRYSGRGLTLADLIEEGNLGLLKAVQNYDPDLGTRFSTYATWWIKQAIRRSLINSVKTVRIPAYMVEAIAKWKNAYLDLTVYNGREPTFDEVADKLEITTHQMEMIRRAMRSATSAGSVSGSDAVWTLTDLLEDPRTQKPEDLVLSRHEQEKIQKMLSEIDKREAEILRMRYGLEDREPATLEAIGEVMGLTRERVRQIENEALKRLHQKMLEEEGIRPPVPSMSKGTVRVGRTGTKGRGK